MPNAFPRPATDLSRRTLLQSLRHFHLRTVLVVPFIVPIIAATSLVGWLSFRNGQQAVSDLATQLQIEVSGQVRQYLDGYLVAPRQINQVNLHAQDIGILNFQDRRRVEKFFWRQMQIFDVGYINYGSKQGEFIGVERLNTGELRLNEVTSQEPGKLKVYTTNQKGDRLKQVEVIDYDFSSDAWYAAAIKAGKPVWSPIYQWPDQPEVMSVSSSYPVRDTNNRIIGVLGVDLIVSQISNFLNQLKIGRSGKLFILERNGLLVANSGSAKVVVGKNDRINRLSGWQSSDPVIQKTSELLKQQFGDLKKIETNQQLSLSLDGNLLLVSVQPWKDNLGLDWLVVTVVPEIDFMAQIHANNRTTILLCLLTFVGATAIGLLTSYWINRQISKLTYASQKLADGNLNERVRVRGIVELENLATSFNTMSEQLQQSFDALQQSEATNRAMVMAIPDLLIRAKKDGTYLDITGADRFSAIHDPEHFQSGTTVYNSLPTHLAEQRMEAIGQALQTGQMQMYEQRIEVGDEWRDEEVRIAVISSDEVLIIVRDITDRKRAEASLKRLTQSFARFFPPEYLKFLRKDSVTQVQLGDHISKEMAMMFSDIRSFTTLSEQMTPEEHFDFVNTYLSQVSPIIRAHDGVIVKFLGDGMMSAFPNSVDDAVAAGIDKFNQVQEYNHQRQAEGRVPIEIGMGIHVGHMMVGIVGEQNRLQGDAFSDNVNLAARLEGLTKFYGASLVISQDVLDRLSHPEKYQIRFLDRAIVKGRKEPIAIYEILDACDELSYSLKLQTLSDFEQGLTYYCNGNFIDAQHHFEQVLRVNSLDKTAKLYQERVQQLRQDGVPLNWNGTWAFTQK